MKIPRWLLALMILTGVGTTLSGAAWLCWCWVNWPVRTATDFAHLMGEGQFAEAERMFNPAQEPDPRTTGNGDWREYFQWAIIEVDPEPSWDDLVHARRWFGVKGIYGSFLVERGRITFHEIPDSAGSGEVESKSR